MPRNPSSHSQNDSSLIHGIEADVSFEHAHTFRRDPHLDLPLSSGLPSAIGILVLVICCVSTALGQAPENEADPSWRTFRERVPGHFQDWIVAGTGPQYTLVYAEPPPAYNLENYGALLKAVFRGYKDHVVATSPLGYNGKVRDLVIHLDYGFAQDPFSALERDVAVLSTAIYGTAHGARLLRLNELAARPKSLKAPVPISVSAAELEGWLLGDREPITLFFPELGISGNLATLSSAGPAGRYLSSDNSLVVLLVERARGVDAGLLPYLRAFAIDSDFILGGMADDKHKFAALIARSRQLPLAEFPALRVEDIVNAITAKDTNWAQSYDRNSPGAGPAVLADHSVEDWAPSYLSPDLVDTEFGSLLNYADAVLKSQSLSNKIRYRGYTMAAFPTPPYVEGVFDHLQKKIGLSSLVFNFNTLGVGHWLAGENGPRVYALNSTGSFSVTYSPDTTGRNSTLDEANPIDEAQGAYTTWFRQQQSPELVRTVQYMAIYQVFSGLQLGGVRLYGDSAAKFQLIGQHLKEAVKIGATASLGRLKGDEQQKLAIIGLARKLLLGGRAPLDALPPLPKTLDELTAAIGDAATMVRYDGNLFGDRNKVLIERYETVTRQSEKAFAPIEQRYKKFAALAGVFIEKYKAYERGEERVWENGEMVVKMRYEVPSSIETAFEREKTAVEALARVVLPVVHYCNRLTKEAENLAGQLKEIQTAYVNRDLLLKTVSLVTAGEDRTAYATEVLKAFAARTSPEKFTESSYAIVTPTVVVSVDQSDATGMMTGGHNVEVQNFTVRSDPGVPVGSFRLKDGELRLNPTDAPKMAQISAKMARVTDADPTTQQQVFAKVLSSTSSATKPRLTALGFDSPATSARFKPGKLIEAAYSATPESSHQLKGTAQGLVFGRDGSSNRLFAERLGSDGKVQRVTMFGATMSPEIIARMSASKDAAAEVTEVMFDSSLGSHDIEAIIASYKNSRGAQPPVAGGAGGIPPRSRWMSGPEPEHRDPRMVLFTDSRNGRRRAVVETERGRVEILIPSNAEGGKLLAALKTNIEAGAELTLKTTSGHRNGVGVEFLLVGFEIVQPTPIKGQVVAQMKVGGGFAQKGMAWFRELMQSAFGSIRSDPALGNTAADYIVEVQRRAAATEPGWKIQCKVEIGSVGMRFVLQPISCAATGDSECELSTDEADPG